MKIRLKGCRRCGGDMVHDRSDREGLTMSCLQCGQEMRLRPVSNVFQLRHTQASGDSRIVAGCLTTAPPPPSEARLLDRRSRAFGRPSRPGRAPPIGGLALIHRRSLALTAFSAIRNRPPLPHNDRVMTKPIRVLLVDDQPSIRRGLRMRLGLEPDIEVVGEASDGSEAVTASVNVEADVVLMDVEMPVMDGITATSLLGDLSRQQQPSSSSACTTTSTPASARASPAPWTSWRSTTSTAP